MTIENILEAINELKNELLEAYETGDNIEIYEIKTEIYGYMETLETMKRNGIK